MRRVNTAVFPEPAPATISSGASSCSTARRCCGLRSASSAAACPEAPAAASSLTCTLTLRRSSFCAGRVLPAPTYRRAGTGFALARPRVAHSICARYAASILYRVSPDGAWRVAARHEPRGPHRNPGFACCVRPEYPGVPMRPEPTNSQSTESPTMSAKTHPTTDIDEWRGEIDRPDAEILAAGRGRTGVAHGPGAARMASGGTRLVHSREMKVIERYSELGPDGKDLAMLLLRMGRGRLGH